MKHVKIIGSSIGSMIAAFELNKMGHKVTIYERGSSVGGLFDNVMTPFGEFELGMHVLYLSSKQVQNLTTIIGEDHFEYLSGNKVDIGASYNFGMLSTNSHYPNILEHSDRFIIENEICNFLDNSANPNDLFQALQNRFGPTAASKIFVPIFEKLWLTRAEDITAEAIHCYFDLRRIVVCDKSRADELKNDGRLDEIIANPDQMRPHGDVFNGRMGLKFKKTSSVLHDNFINWAKREGIEVHLNKNVSFDGNMLMTGQELLTRDCDACIVSVPVHTLANKNMMLDAMELSIYYFKINEKAIADLSCYYILIHEPDMVSSRIVNYAAYSQSPLKSQSNVIAVEVLHQTGSSPETEQIHSELAKVFPNLQVQGSFKFPKQLKIMKPTLSNMAKIDRLERKIKLSSPDCKIYFTGMRTDKGMFFSHQTIGSAHDAALEFHKQFS